MSNDDESDAGASILLDLNAKNLLVRLGNALQQHNISNRKFVQICQENDIPFTKKTFQTWKNNVMETGQALPQTPSAAGRPRLLSAHQEHLIVGYVL